jgi:hypothetical protein
MSYPNLPIEILNMIFSYVGPSPIVEILKPKINKYLTSNDCIAFNRGFNEWILKETFFYRLNRYYYNSDNIRVFEEGEKIRNEWLKRKLPSENRLIPRILYNSLDDDVLTFIKYKREPHPNAEILNNEIKSYIDYEVYAYKYIKNLDGDDEYEPYRLKTFCEKRLRTDYESEDHADNPLIKLGFAEKRKFKRYYKEVILEKEPKLSRDDDDEATFNAFNRVDEDELEAYYASQQYDSDSDSELSGNESEDYPH